MPRIVEVTEECLKAASPTTYAVHEESTYAGIFDMEVILTTKTKSVFYMKTYYYLPGVDDKSYYTTVFAVEYQDLDKKIPLPFKFNLQGLPGRISAKNN